MLATDPMVLCPPCMSLWVMRFMTLCHSYWTGDWSGHEEFAKPAEVVEPQ